MLKRVLALVLAGSLLLLLLPAACGEERPVLTIGDLTTRSGKRYDGDLGMWQYLAERLGVEIRYVYLTPEEYAAGLASGSLPDVVATQNNLSTILEYGAALDAEPYLAEYCPNLLEGVAGLSHDVFVQLVNGGEGFYFFPAKIGYNGVGYDNVVSARGYVVRWDYYKELGYPPINSEEDYLNVLLQMHANHPYTEEGYPTYLYGTNNFNGYDTAFRSEFSLNYWTAHFYQSNIFTNEIYDGYTDPDHSMWWSAKAWYNKLYRAGKDDGSFDLELFTQSQEQFDAKCERGQYLGLHAVSSSLYKRKVQEDPDTLAGYASVPTAAANYYTNVYQLLGNGPAYMWFISANSPNKENALRLFNLMADPDFLRECFLGRKGETWDTGEDGVPRMTDYGQEQLDAYMAGTASPDNYFVRWGAFDRMPTNWPVLRDNVLHPDGYPLDFATTSREYTRATMTNNISLDICEHYGTELPTDAFYAAGGLDYRNDCGEAVSSAIGSVSGEKLRIIAEAGAILDDARVDLILAETEEEWNAIRDETLRQLTELGEPEVFLEYRQIWNEAADVIVPMVLQVQEANGLTLYTPEDYERFPSPGKEGSAP